MPCDERYRSWAMQRGPVPTKLIRVSDCPARPGFRELQFEADGTAWSWCFPPAAEPYSGPGVRSLILRSGPQGLLAEAVIGGTGVLPATTPVDLASAADLAMTGVPVFADRCLIGPPSQDEARPVRGTDAAAVRHQQAAR